MTQDQSEERLIADIPAEAGVPVGLSAGRSVNGSLSNPGHSNQFHDVGADFVFENVPLAPYTSFRIGGPADTLIGVRQMDRLVALLETAGKLGQPVYVFGRGSNLLFSDKGRRGIVVRNESSATELKPHGVVVVDSGVRLPALAIETAKRGFTGLEWAVGIPGTVGGAVAMNAGAQGSCVADVLVAAVVHHRQSVVELATSEMEYSYRSSRLRWEREKIVLRALFQLHPADSDECLALVEEYRSRRKATQPTEPGAGSIFKNPAGEYAGQLIEAVGLKGRRVGNALVSHKHANFIINMGQATSADVRELMEVIQERVHDQFGTWLEPEIELVGEGQS